MISILIMRYNESKPVEFYRYSNYIMSGNMSLTLDIRCQIHYTFSDHCHKLPSNVMGGWGGGGILSHNITDNNQISKEN